MSFNNNTVRTPRSGDFLPFGEGASRHIEAFDWRGSYTTGGVRLDHYRTEMGDGTQYNVTLAAPPAGERATDVLTVASNPWFVRERGPIRRELLALARMGMASCFIGVANRNPAIGHIEDDVLDHIEIAHHATALTDTHPHAVAYSGVSHGAMNGLAFASLSQQHGIEVIHGDFRAPCFPEHVADTDILRNARRLVNELGGLATLLTKTPLRALSHYGATLDLSPQAVLNHAKDIPTLLGGSVGTLVREGLPENTFAHLSISREDVLSQAEQWEELFADDRHPAVTLDIRPGGSHIEACFGEATVQRRLGRAATILATLREHEPWIVGRSFDGAAATRLRLAVESRESHASPARSELGLVA